MLKSFSLSTTGFLIALPASVLAQGSDVQQSLSFGASASFFHESSGSESGSQVFAPLQYTYSSERFDFGVRSAYLSSSRTSDFDGNSGNVGTLTDTSVSGTYRVYAGQPDLLNGRRVTVAINGDINLPTGRSTLTGEEKNAVFDGFIVDQNRFGEGLNFGLGVSSTVSLSSDRLLGFALGYVSKGTFEPDGDAPDQVLDPGDQLVGSVQYFVSKPSTEYSIGYRLIAESPTNVNGTAVYDRATSHELFGTIAHQVSDRVVINGAALYATRGTDRILDEGTGDLVASTSDNNGDSYFVSLGADYLISDRDVLGVDVSIRHQAENEFDEEDFAFAPSLTRREIGLSYQRAISDGLTVTGGVSYFDVEEGQILGFDGPKYSGVTVSMGVRREF